MSFLLRIAAKLPIPAKTRLACQRTLLDRTYAKSIAIARKANDKAKVQSLEHDHRLELEMQDEEEDANLTNSLLAKARRLHVPVPHRYNTDKTESEHWYESHYTGRWSLTARGVASLREEIRREEKARHEGRAQWIVWLSALTGVIGTITGLVALLMRKCP
jgi:hypothetical protein